MTYKLIFCIVLQEPNEELLPLMRLRIPYPGYGLDDGYKLFSMLMKLCYCGHVMQHL